MPKPNRSLLSDLTAAPVETLPQLVAVGALRVAPGEKSPRVPLALPVGGPLAGSAGLCVVDLGRTQPPGVFSRGKMITDTRSLTVFLHRRLDEAKERNLEKLAHRYHTLREHNVIARLHLPGASPNGAKCDSPGQRPG
jgi:hypothetical protein